MFYNFIKIVFSHILHERNFIFTYLKIHILLNHNDRRVSAQTYLQERTIFFLPGKDISPAPSCAYASLFLIRCNWGKAKSRAMSPQRSNTTLYKFQ